MAGKDKRKAARALAAVGRERKPGEARRVEYNPAVHPGLVSRALRFLGVEEAAAVVGIPAPMLRTWLEIHPEMEQARARVAGRDLEILESLEATALGERNPETGKYDKGNPALLMFLARTRLGMHKPMEWKGDVADMDMLTPEESIRAALRMAKDSDPVVD